MVLRQRMYCVSQSSWTKNVFSNRVLSTRGWSLLRGSLPTFEFNVVIVIYDTYPIVPNICMCQAPHMAPLCAKRGGTVIEDCIRSRQIDLGFKWPSQTRKSLSTRLYEPKNVSIKNLDWNSELKCRQIRVSSCRFKLLWHTIRKLLCLKMES